MIKLVCMVVAILCFVFAAAGMPSKINLTALGLAFFAAAFLVTV